MMKKHLLFTSIVVVLTLQPLISQNLDDDIKWILTGGQYVKWDDGSTTRIRTPRITLTNDGGFFYVETNEGKYINIQGVLDSKYSWNFYKEDENLKRQFSGSVSSGGIASDVKQTSDGGYIIVGYASNSLDDALWGIIGEAKGGKDFKIFKLDNFGKQQWRKSIGGSNDEIAYSVQQTLDGGYVVAGYSSSNDFDISGNHGNKDCLIIKLNKNGNTEWSKSIGGVNNDIAYCIQQTSDGGYIIVGKSDSNDGFLVNNNGANDLLIVKLDFLGNTQWVKSIGGSNEDIAYSVKQTKDNGYIIAGQTNSVDFDIQGNHGGVDCFLVKLNENGNTEWNRCIGGTSEDVANSVQQTIDGGYVVAGYSSSNDFDISGNHGMKDFLYLKLDSNGNIRKQKCTGTNSDDMAYSVNQTVDGGVILAGDISYNDNNPTFSYSMILKYNPSLSDDNFEYLNSNITIAPNPASSHININFNNITDLNGGELKIINSLGQQVATTPITTSGKQTIMQLATWGGAGLYFVQIINPQGQIVDIKKIILQ